VEVVALMRRCVFLRPAAEIGDQFLEQRISINFSVKLGKNATHTYVMLSVVYGGEAVKKSSVFEWYKHFKESSDFEITNVCNVQHFIHIKNIVHLTFIPQGQTVNQACYVEILKRTHEAVHRRMPALGPTVKVSTMTSAPHSRRSC
jgi:hypothetical protein